MALGAILGIACIFIVNRLLLPEVNFSEEEMKERQEHDNNQ